MNISRFRATNLPQAIEQVRQKLGREAIILDVRHVGWKGPLRFLSPMQVEVTAASNPRPPTEEGSTNRNVVVLRPVHSGDKAESGYRLPSRNGSTPESADPLSRSWIKALRRAGVEENLASEVVENLPASPWNEDETRERLLCLLASIVPRPAPIVHRKRRKVAAFVGPTGTGKTTALAKLAAHFHLQRGKSIGLISTDIYRIAATDQLETYAGIIGVPLEIAFTPRDMERSLERFARKDLVLIDTPGRSHRDRQGMSFLARMLRAARPDQVHLLLPAGTAAEDAEEIDRAYSVAGHDRLLLTKLDETSVPGRLLHLLRKTGKPLSYLTTGQRVPGDIQVAHGIRLAMHILAIATADLEAAAVPARERLHRVEEPASEEGRNRA